MLFAAGEKETIQHRKINSKAENSDNLQYGDKVVH